MLELIHSHWRRRRVCKVRCKGVPTVDMDNICQVIEVPLLIVLLNRFLWLVYLLLYDFLPSNSGFFNQSAYLPTHLHNIIPEIDLLKKIMILQADTFFW